MQDLNHTAWTDRNGAPSGAVSMAQTPDGWLWLGGKDGLYRFDGVRFERIPLPDNQVDELHALSNGDLLVSLYYGRVVILHQDGRIQNIGAP